MPMMRQKIADAIVNLSLTVWNASVSMSRRSSGWNGLSLMISMMDDCSERSSGIGGRLKSLLCIGVTSSSGPVGGAVAADVWPSDEYSPLRTSCNEASSVWALNLVERGKNRSLTDSSLLKMLSRLRSPWASLVWRERAWSRMKKSRLHIGQQPRRLVSQGSTQSAWNTWPQIRPRTSSSSSRLSRQIAHMPEVKWRSCAASADEAVAGTVSLSSMLSVLFWSARSTSSGGEERAS
ncbi:hypothetical protein OGATHE_004067 [Ogataea polymorpha]|uniref:Uncharacterized protein n=1 Tax=Ogataea polymorpha TaxID=460523 RepID=A0A9P8P4U8_9ASCO|nr:hypothetical protein OGATHE_004067 [Ogataea polymorpha]